MFSILRLDNEMRVVLDKNGELLESQSDATPGTLIVNQLQYGHREADLIERTVGPGELAALLAVVNKPKGEALAGAIKAECQRRIYSVVDQIAQVNLAAAAAGGVFAPEQMTVYRVGLAWIASMRAACGQLVVNKDETFEEDRHWPDPGPTIIALADQF